MDQAGGGLARPTATCGIVSGFHANQRPILVDDCLLACARAAQWLDSASRENDAKQRTLQRYERIDLTADIASTATLGRAITIGQHTTVGPGCVIGDGVRIGDYCEIGANVSVSAAATIGNRVTVGANCVIGGEPFLYARDGAIWLKLPSFGSVTIGDDVVIGCNTTVDRGALGDTSIRRGTIMDNQVHIGHGTVIGEHSAIAAQCVVAGEVTIGASCVIGGAVGIAEGVSIAPNIRITGMSLVSKSLAEAGVSYSSGWPVQRSRRWWRQVATATRET
jgi:UDP-3-O-[3-hydroxymyristoyl] glucosamine N-acyltransferase